MDEVSRRLAEARRRGFLGPAPVEAHVAHALAFLPLVGEPALGVDLGSGGGVPGLVLAVALPASRWVLVEAQARRADFLQQALRPLGLADRVTVRCERAEVAARRPELWRSADVVTARGFGPPAAVAEVAVGFLRLGGRLVVSDVVEGTEDRWPAAGLAALGLERVGSPAGFTVCTVVRAAPDRFPRRRLHPPLF